MSVAFRRESDEEHKEPKFEIPLPSGPNLVTRRGLTLIQAKVAELEERIAICENDGEIEDARRELRYWLTRQSTAQFAPPPDPGIAGFGTRVTLLFNRRERIVDIVGDDEAEPANGRLSFSAPLSQTLIGGEAGDVFDFGGTPGAIEIVAIDPIEE